MKIKYFFFLAIFLFIYSCKKNECVTADETKVNNSFYPLTVGSYWIYHWYQVDTFGNEELLIWADTTKVLKDTLIDGIVFKKIEDKVRIVNGEKIYQYLRGANGDLLNRNGDILFSSTNFIDTLSLSFIGNVAETVYKMAIPDSPITTPLGEFDCLNFRGRTISLIPLDWTEKINNNYYSKGVGKVMSNYFFYSTPDDYQRRLVEYHIE